MFKHRIQATLAAFALAAAGLASANPVVSLVGDIDDMGLTRIGANTFDIIDLQDLSGSTDGTDIWIEDGTHVTHVSVLNGTLIGATLDLRSVGWGGGEYVLAEVFFNGISLGFLSAGEQIDPDPQNFVVEDSFDLSLLLNHITGNDVVSIRPADALDYGVLDYSRLTLNYASSPGGGNAPEPASLALAGLGLVAALVARRRRAG